MNIGLWIAVGVIGWLVLSVGLMLLIGRAVALADAVERTHRRRQSVLGQRSARPSFAESHRVVRAR